MIQADFAILSDYRPVIPENKLKCNISMFFGSDEDICGEKELCGWSEMTEGQASYQMFHGDHLFLLEQYIPITEAVTRTLKCYRR